ncbi:MAG: caspase family protein [Desulfamplus sp.]|nr:caspase family protein [Desulfamplus sp.]
MKTQLISSQFFIFYFLFLVSSSVYSMESPKILLIITQTSQSQENNIDSKTFATLLNNQLFKKGYQVVNSDELNISSSLTSQDILETKKGNMVHARKVAASYNIDFILSTDINSQVSSREIYGMQMKSAVSEISYKFFDMAANKILDIDNRQYRGGSKTAEEAKHVSFKKMAEGICETVILKNRYAQLSNSYTPDKLSSSSSNKLSSSDNSSSSSSSDKFSSSQNRDDVPPKIILTSPSVTRGIQIKIQPLIKETLIEGIVEAEHELQYLKINGEILSINGNGRFSKLMSLKESEQNIVIEASDILGNRAIKKFDLVKEEVHDKPLKESALWGLAVGVSLYQNKDSNLAYADKDALSIADFFRNQKGKLFSEVHFKTLVNDQVTRDSIIENIGRHLNSAAPNDVVFLFMAGHGIKHRQTGSYYFVPHDADMNNIVSKGLRMSDFEESVKILSTNVNKVIIAMDTCHSGSMQVGARSGGSGEKNLAEVMKEASGIYVIAASKGDEVSLESENFKLHKEDSGHGVFTYALLQGMSGEANYDKNHYVSLNEVFQYIAIQIPRLTNGVQHPYFRSEGTDMPLVILEH